MCIRILLSDFIQFQECREGEILALQVQDIGTDRIFILHSYSPYEGGLKPPKNREEREVKEGLENLEEEKRIHENARSHVSERIHNVFKFLRKKKKEIEAKEKLADQKLSDSLEISQRAEQLRVSTASPYFTFADDIKFDDARLMAAKGDGKGLCSWFNGLGHKFGAWLHKAQYFAKHFWNKKSDDLIGVAEDMRNSYCNSLGEYIEKGMKAQTLSQIKETREIKEKIAQVRKKSRSRDDGWEWKKILALHIVTKTI